MKHNINERFVQFSQTKWGPFQKSIDPDADVVVTINGERFIGSVVKVEYRNNQDGTFDEVPIVKFFSTD